MIIMKRLRLPTMLVLMPTVILATTLAICATHKRTAVVTTVSNTTAGVGTTSVNCIIRNHATALQVTINCTGTGASMNSTLPSPIVTPGTVGDFALNGNIISWGLMPFNGPNAVGICPVNNTVKGTCWQVVTNGVMRNGVF